MTESAKRISWGEPYALSPEEADAARDLIDYFTPTLGTKVHRQWAILRSVLIPPVEACSGNRATIEASADWLFNLDSPPGVTDPGYTEFEVEAGKALQKPIDAFKSRPAGCEMEMSGDDDCFNCNRCNFSATTDVFL